MGGNAQSLLLAVSGPNVAQVLFKDPHAPHSQGEDKRLDAREKVGSKCPSLITLECGTSLSH